MFDLIDECGQDLKKFGYTIKKLDRYGISVASLEVKSKSDSEKIGLSKGEYYIFNSPFVYQFGDENDDYLSKIMSRRLKSLFKKFNITSSSRIFIVGLGNPDITADRLGKEVFDKLEINPLQKNNNIYKFCPNIFFSTGIDTLSMVKMFTRELKIDLVIIIDSLTTSNIARLGTSFQITTSGMTPGSGVNRLGNRICKESVGAECISIGVPFMIYSSSLNNDDEIDIILSPKDISENVRQAGTIIANAISEVIK